MAGNTLTFISSIPITNVGVQYGFTLTTGNYPTTPAPITHTVQDYINGIVTVPIEETFTAPAYFPAPTGDGITTPFVYTFADDAPTCSTQTGFTVTIGIGERAIFDFNYPGGTQIASTDKNVYAYYKEADGTISVQQ